MTRCPIAPHWLHQLLTMGIDKSRRIHSILGKPLDRNMAILTFWTQTQSYQLAIYKHASAVKYKQCYALNNARWLVRAFQIHNLPTLKKQFQYFFCHLTNKFGNVFFSRLNLTNFAIFWVKIWQNFDIKNHEKKPVFATLGVAHYYIHLPSRFIAWAVPLV